MRDSTFRAIIISLFCLCFLRGVYMKVFVVGWHERVWKGEFNGWDFLWGLILWLIVVPGLIAIAQESK